MADKLSTKIALSDIANLQQLIDQAPARSATEVSKRQAIGILAPNLYELRAKGYAWRDVAAWLTEHGLTVTVSALQRYLRGVKPRALNSSGGRLAGPRSKAAPDGKTGSRTPLTLLADVPVIPPGTGQKNVPVAGPPPRNVTARTHAHETPRSGFVPRPDTKDL